MKFKRIIPIASLLFLIFAFGCDKKDEEANERPQVVSTEPLSDANSIDISTLVTARFSTEMDPATLNTSTFTLKDGATNIQGTVTSSGVNATFTPTNPLELDTEYTAAITTGAEDISGNPLTTNVEWNFTTFLPGSGPDSVNLMAAGNYAILAKSAISNNSTSAIKGDLGLSPAATSYITGFSLTNETGYATSAQVDGRIYAADMASPVPANLTVAVDNMNTAYNDAAGRTSPHFLELGTGNIGGKTLVAGLYKWSGTVTVPTDVIISGDTDDVWIFQIAGDLSVNNGVNVTLTGNVQAKNIFWQVAGTVTIGAGAHFEGIILSKTSVILQTGASLTGRALAQTAVVLDSNVVTQPGE